MGSNFFLSLSVKYATKEAAAMDLGETQNYSTSVNKGVSYKRLGYRRGDRV